MAEDGVGEEDVLLQVQEVEQLAEPEALETPRSLRTPPPRLASSEARTPPPRGPAPDDEPEPDPELGPDLEPEPEPEPEPDAAETQQRLFDTAGQLQRQRSSEKQRDERLRQMLAIVEGIGEGEIEGVEKDEGEELTRTPSVQEDIQTARARNPYILPPVLLPQVARAQRMRKQCRLLDAEIAEANSELIRAALLRGPSGARFECDSDCVVGGCGKDFAEEEGVLCDCCKLFLCHACFGATVVTNECQQGGRFDSDVRTGSAISEPGSLPCPLFPQDCRCGHTPLHQIRRAMLHPRNRGLDGAEEDVHSSGLSANKIHLLARQRWAEGEARKTNGGAGGDAGVRLVRTITERAAFTLADGNDTGMLADKLDELEQLRVELLARPAAAAIPAHIRRTCAQCHGEFAAFEGGECQYFSNRVQRHSHFLCALCYGGYIMRACSEGGSFEQEIKNKAGIIVSAPGQLPCPFAEFHSSSQLVPRGQGVADLLGAMDCRCGAVPSSEIETVLLDPRNNSFQFWRTRYAESVVLSHADSTIAIDNARPGDALPPGWTEEQDQMSGQTIYFNNESGEIAFERPAVMGWSREVELLGRGFTPANLHETARLRVAIANHSAVAAELQALEATRRKAMDPDAVALAELRMSVIDALDRGGSIRCPRCGVRAVKDDACIHIDSCQCGSHFCFLCGSEECPRGGGCDEVSIYLEKNPGWDMFALAGETTPFGAQQEFLRRRQAFCVRAVMENTDPQKWEKLRKKYPDMLANTPTNGRSIDWDSLSTADMPLFGANLAQPGADDGQGNSDTAQQRLAEHWEQVRIEQERDRLREAQRRRHQNCCIPTLAVLISVLLVSTHVLMTAYPPPSPSMSIDTISSLSGEGTDIAPQIFLPEPEPESLEPEPMPILDSEPVESICNLYCQVLGWWEAAEFSLGLFCILGGCCRHFSSGKYFKCCRDWRHGPDQHVKLATLLCLLTAFAIFWPIAVAIAEGVGTGGWLVLVDVPWSIAYPLGSAGQAIAAVWLLSAGELMFRSTEQDNRRVNTPVRLCAMLAFVGLYVFLMFKARMDRVEDEKPDPTDEFVCNGLCQSLTYSPIVLMVVGSVAGATALAAWLHHGHTRTKEVVAFLAVSVFFAPLLFWPASLEREEWVWSNGFLAVVLAPLCAFIFGAAWASFHVMVAIEQVRGGGVGDRIFVPVACICGCGGFVLFGLWVFAVISTRSDNESLMLPDEVETFSCNDAAACQYLQWVPAMELAVGASMMVVSLICFARGRGTERCGSFMTNVIGLCLTAWPTTLWSFGNMHSLATTKWSVAYLIAPISNGIGLPLYLTVCFMTVVQAYKSRQFYDVLNGWHNHGERVMLQCLAAIVVLNTAAYIGCMVSMRQGISTWVATTSHEAASTMVYTCTWPCVALRIACCVAVGTVLISLWKLIHCRFAFWMQAHPLVEGPDLRATMLVARKRKTAWCGMLLASLVCVGLLSLAVAEAWMSWPLETPVEALVTGPAVSAYCMIPAFFALSFSGSWRVLLQSADTRARMLSDAYDMPGIIFGISAIGAGWLTFVLRSSADNQYALGSLRSQIYKWECVCVCFWGPISMLWCWNYRRAEARRRACRILARTVLLWVPAAGWPLVQGAWSGSDDDSSIDTMLSEAPVATALAASISLSVVGFSFEVASCLHYQRVLGGEGWCGGFSGRQQVVGAALSALVLMWCVLSFNLACLGPDELGLPLLVPGWECQLVGRLDGSDAR